MRVAVCILILAFVVLSSACGTVAPVTRSIPHELLQDCVVGSELRVGTNAELSTTVLKLAHTLKLCNIDKQKLREWASDD